MNDRSESEILLELLAARATEGLDAQDQARLDALLRQRPDEDDDSLDLAAAALDAALLDEPLEDLPPNLKRKLQAEADDFLQRPTPVRSAQPTRSPAPDRPRLEPAIDFDPYARPPRRKALAWAGWLAAAAMLVLSLIAWYPLLTRSSPQSSAAEMRQQLLQEQGEEALQLAWSATDDPAAAGARGDVVWSKSRQAGYMRFSGLSANDPSASQYQLWIFDRSRDDRFPVDGGVFDIPPGAAEVIVPIQAKLSVDQAYLFAVTVEQPGGVVVSSRERIVLLGQAP